MACRSLILCFLTSMVVGPVAADQGSGNPESRLVKSLQAINESRLDVALSEVDSLLQESPNFKLAHLVKGDLLMARAGALGGFGSAANAPRDEIDGLRDEAVVRLQRILSQTDQQLVPRFLWQLEDQQKYALVVDTSRSTLFVYENTGNGVRYVEDFYITIGKLGAEKSVEGDRRTPLGVYFITSHLSPRQLSDFYGIGAWPLDYPNEWDLRNKRTGSGIWLHGTPSDTYSRPPRASNGCVVLANDDLKRLSAYLAVGVTPVIITDNMDWQDADNLSWRDDLLQNLEQWRSDWSRLDTEAYLGHYAHDFSSGNMDYSAWGERKQQVNSSKSWASIELSNISIFTYPQQPDLAVVNFEQDYRSNNLSNRMKKRQYWIRRNNQWKIIYEGAA